MQQQLSIWKLFTGKAQSQTVRGASFAFLIGECSIKNVIYSGYFYHPDFRLRNWLQQPEIDFSNPKHTCFFFRELIENYARLSNHLSFRRSTNIIIKMKHWNWIKLCKTVCTHFGPLLIWIYLEKVNSLLSSLQSSSTQLNTGNLKCIPIEWMSGLSNFRLQLLHWIYFTKTSHLFSTYQRIFGQIFNTHKKTHPSMNYSLA